ncbi:unnamed protein product [Euphydryas editha]|uniref:Cuticle protein n=1 Tax=Euphydryas editha TaxID=104508 RepID=A0AAU9V5B1_EUPED|nr:unnamed protein product [Euphydryas editha]
MISKIIVFTTALLLVNAQHNSYEQSKSSQSLSSQDSTQSQQSYTEPIVHRPALFRRPFALHLAPVHEDVVENRPPVHVASAAATINKVLPSVHQVTPSVQYVSVKTPTVHYTTPDVAPIISHNIPVQTYNYNHADLHQEYNTNPEYEVKYSVEDHHTGDIKSLQEKRYGDHVTGYYSLQEPDGSVRTVHYDANKHTGFNAKVEISKPSTHVQPNHQIVYSHN